MNGGADALARIEGPAPASAFTVDWRRSLACLPPVMPWDGSDLAACADAAGLDHRALAAVSAAARRVAADLDLRQVAWHLHRRLFDVPELGCPWGGPVLPALGPEAGAVRLLVALSFVGRLRRAHQARGYPADVTSDTLRQLACFDANHRAVTGLPGLLVEQAPWLTTYFRHPYVRLGRLEFELRDGDPGCRIFRKDGVVMVLADSGVRCTATGMVAADDEATAWTTAGEGRAGHPVDPGGRIQPDRIELDDGWQLLHASGGPLLHVHIPAGGGLAWDACRESFRRARAFFQAHHGDRAIRLFTCHTWFLDAQVDAVLGRDSNPARFRDHVWNLPTRPDAGSLWFVFLRATADPATLPRDSSMRRAFADFLARGGRWRGGAMILPVDVLEDDSRRWRWVPPDRV